MPTPELTPVIIAVGEHVDRPDDPKAALEPLALMARALTAADADGGTGLLGRIETLDLVGLISWRYEDPAAALCGTLGIGASRATNASMGGETPIRLIH
ncbi:MAG: acetyl-CoA acetyltransferase, partial [Caulobacter sp. 12-67-6]